MDLAQTLTEYPDLRQFLTSDDWLEEFFDAPLVRGRRIFQSGQVLTIEAMVSGSGVFNFSSPVQGSRRSPYDTLVSVIRASAQRWDLWGQCSCPVGSDCKHAAALMFELQRRANSLPQATGNYETWLAALKQESQASTQPLTKKKAARQTGALAYLIHPRRDGQAELSFGKLRLRIGKEPTVDNVSLTPNFKNKAPAYYQNDDADLVMTIQQRLPKISDENRYWYEKPILEGAFAEDLLERLLASERLYLKEAFIGSEKQEAPRPLQKAPTQKLAPAWETDQDGNSIPTIGLARATHKLLDLGTPYYLDTADGMIGKVETEPGQSVKLLQLWQDGPAITPDKAEKLSAELTESSITAKLPTPRKLTEIILEHDGPQPRLTLSQGQVLEYLLQETFGGSVRQRIDHLISAKLSFDYADKSIPFTAELEEQKSICQEGTLLIIHRDNDKERTYIEDLVSRDLRPLGDLYPREQISPSKLNRFVPQSHPVDWPISWAQYLAEDFEELRQKGWTIELDKSVDLSVTKAEDFFTELTEDEGSGIDWFQFDTGIISNEGQRISLMDLIANFISNEDSIPEEESFEADDRVLVAGESGAYFEVPAERFFRIVRSVQDLFSRPDEGIHRLEAARLADELELDDSQTLKDLRALGEQLRKKEPHKPVPLPKKLKADLRDYQKDGFQWLQFMACHHLHGILADDMGLGKTLQTLAHIAAEIENKKTEKKPCLVIAPTSVVPNWAAEAAKFYPTLKVLVLHGSDRKEHFKTISKSHLVITSYALLVRDEEIHHKQDYHLAILDEAQYIKNPKAKVAVAACSLKAKHRLCLSGTPMENHLGELWSLTRFLMPGLLGNQKNFNSTFKNPIEKQGDPDAQRALNHRVTPLLLRRTKDQVVLELPAKTEIIHRITLNKPQQDLYESVRVAMDKKVRGAIEDKGLARSQIIVLDALLKLRQICCHPQLLKTDIAKKATDSAKLDFLTELLATLIEEGRRILLFSQFTTMLGKIEAHLKKEKIKYVKITGATRDRKTPVEKFQEGTVPIFLISLKAGGTGLNLTAADTVIHYDPWWNPAAENQATDRAHRIGQKKPVFVHKLISEGTIEERILELQARKSKLVEALLSEKTNKLNLDTEMLENLLAPIDV